MWNVEQGKYYICLNGRDIYLCGVLDCVVFFLIGYLLINVDDWKCIFIIIKEYGMNYVCFYFWCLLEVVFEVGDEVGMYFQVEFFMWIKDVGKYFYWCDFFEKEMYVIFDVYGNYFFFILMCNGNENEGDFVVLEDLVKKVQKYDN